MFEFDAGDSLDDVRQSVDGDDLAAAKVDGLEDVTGEDGLKAVAMVEAGYRSSQSGQAIDLR